MAVDAARAKSLFLAASDLADLAERAAYLDRACGDDANLRARVDALLRANDAAPLPVAPEATVDSADGQLALADDSDPTARVGAVLAGKYKLVEKIGEGGMGSVFMAQQTEPVKRAVAVKVIKAGMDSRAVLVRFEAERQALAMMDHPNIAKVLDAGATKAGRPYFVMELVKGVPITRYCDEHQLTLRQRIELFVPVCQAIQHAHQKGIIHRDIKPSNVLVALYDDCPVPKVIDFGVAKAAGQSLTDKTLMTGFGALVGTPEYMSPEQASLNNLDIDTRSDVYSLGVLLYELLTGSTPVDRKSLGKAALLEVLRIVREVEAPRPSARLSTIDTLPSVAANRGTEPARLSRLMKGELDWVVMKALEKDRTRRYDTANGLARDIQRYLADEVVEARPPSMGYRVSKFVRRHKGQVIAASLVLLTLLGGMVGTTLGLLEAQRQEQIARDEAAEKEKARLAEAERVSERDQALGKAKDALGREAERIKERDEANDELKHRLGVSNMLLVNAALGNRDVVLAAERLDKVPTEQRGWAWRSLKRQTRGGIFTLYGHRGPVTCVSFSPDGARILSAGGNQHDLGEAKVWDARTGGHLLDLEGLPQVQGMNIPVTNVSFSSDGRRILTAGENNTARVCDAQTGKVLLELKGHTTPVTSLAFSPDGTRIVTGGSSLPRFLGRNGITGVQGPGQTKVWDAQTGKELFELKGHRGDVSSVAFSPDGTRIVTAGADFGVPGEMKVWDAQKGGPALLDLKGHVTGETTVAFSPDGTRIVTGREDGTAAVIDARTGVVLRELKGHTRAGQDSFVIMRGVFSASFSPDGTRIVTAGGFGGIGEATVWDVRTGTVLLDLKGHTNLVMSVAFSPDGTRIVTGCADGTIKLWDARTGTPRLELDPAHGVHCLSVSPDGTRIATAGGKVGKSGAATVWDARTGAVLLERKQFRGLVKCVSFSPDGTRIVTGGGESGKPGEATVWDARTGTVLVELKGFKEGVLSASFSPDGTRIVTGEGEDTNARGGAKVFNAHTGALLLDLTEPGPEVGFLVGARGECVSFSRDGTRIVVGGYRNHQTLGNQAKVIDAQTGKTLVELKGHAEAVYCVAFSPDGTRVVTGSRDRTVKVWDAQTGTALLDLKGHAGEVNSVVFHPDGTLIVSGSGDQTVRVWDTRTGTVLVELRGHTSAVTGVAFTPDGTRIVSGGRGTASEPGEAVVWDARPVPTPCKLKGHTAWIAGVAFSPDSTRIATASMDGTVKLWDTRTGAVLHKLAGFRGNVQGVAFSPDGTRLVTTGDGTTAKVWDARTGSAVFDLKGRPGVAQCVAFSPDGTRLVTGGHRFDKPNQGRGEATVWDSRTGAPLFDLTGHATPVHHVAFSLDGSRLVTRGYDGSVKVWDARSGKELPSNPVPITLKDGPISPNGSLFARRVTHGIEIISLKPDAKETAYRLLHTRPDVRRYREGYRAARVAKDAFAAGFYLNLLPHAERKAAEAQADQSLFDRLTADAETHLRARKPDRAVAVLVELWDLKKAKLGPGDPSTLATMNRLGVIYWQMRQLDRSVPLFEELLKLREASLGRDHQETQRSVANLGVNYKDAGRLKEAIPLLEEAHRATKKYPALRFVREQLHDAYARTRENAKLADLLLEQLTEIRTALPKDSPQLAGVLAQIGLGLLEQKKWAKAEPILRECLAIRAKTQPALWMTFNTQSMLGGALLGQKKYAEAEPLLLQGYEGMKAREKMISPQGLPRLPEALDRLIELCTATDKPDDVKKWRAERAKYPNLAPPPREKK